MNEVVPTGYKKTKVGVIPVEWECLPARNYFTKRINKGYAGLEIYSVTINKSWQKRSELDREIGSDVDVDKSLLAEKGDLVYNTMRMWQGALGVAENSGVISPAYIVMRPKSNIIPQYAFYLLKSYTYLHYLKAYSYGLTSDRLRLYFEDFGMIPFVCPPIDEQNKIVEILSTCDSAIETTERLIAAKERYFDGLAKQFLITDQIKALKKAKLGVICDINKGTQLNKTDMIGDAKYPVINGGTGPSGYTDQWNADAYSIAISEGGNSCGYINYMTEKFWSGGHCYTLKNIKINQEYLFHFLKANEKFIMALRVGSGLPNIQKKSLERFEVHYPDKEAEQARIAEILNTAKREIDLLKKLAESYRLQKRGLMQKLLSGEWRVAA